MNIQVAVLCDAATDDNGKLSLLGAFDTIFTQAFPAVHLHCSLALRVTFGHEDEGHHSLKLNFMDEDGHPLIPHIDIPFKVMIQEEAHFSTRNFIVNFQQLKFPQAGLYSLDVAFDGKVQTSVPLLVKLPPDRAAQVSE
jgi:hypothetical protein